MLYNYLQLKHPMPFPVTLGLLGHGQFMLGHILAAEFRKAAVPMDRALVVIRDLRLASISYARFLWKRQKRRSLNGQADMLEWARTVLPGYLARARSHLELLNEGYPEVRFEELIRPEPEVMGAIARSQGQPTMTWSGKLSDLESYWTPEIEKVFSEMGGDALNEQLGYPRNYTPESYPGGEPVVDHSAMNIAACP